MHPLRSEIGPVAWTAQHGPRFLRAVHQTLVDAGAGHWAALRRLSVLHRPPHPPPHAALAPALPQNRRFFRSRFSQQLQCHLSSHEPATQPAA
eukprot:COSAG01_NODE_30456_length_615_cov_2.474806_1_plen_92_part_10